MIYLVKADGADGSPSFPTNIDDTTRTGPAFMGTLEPDVTFLAFELSVTELTNGAGHYFVFEEHAAATRFGLDDSGPDAPVASSVTSTADLDWSHTGILPGGHLSTGAIPGVVADLTLSDDDGGGTVQAKWGHNSAHFGAITMQQPFRRAIHSSEVL